jgi:hypothetical protein
VTEFVFLWCGFCKKLELLRVAAIAMEVAGRDTDQPYLLPERKLPEKPASDGGDVLAGFNELIEGALFRVRGETRVPQLQCDFSCAVSVFSEALGDVVR